MKKQDYRITDENGIHARPAGRIVKTAREFRADTGIILPETGKRADGKKLFEVMGLGVKKGDTIRLETEGEDEAEAMKKLLAVLRDAGL
jgi:phosphocarrier protein